MQKLIMEGIIPFKTTLCPSIIHKLRLSTNIQTIECCQNQSLGAHEMLTRLLAITDGGGASPLSRVVTGYLLLVWPFGHHCGCIQKQGAAHAGSRRTRVRKRHHLKVHLLPSVWLYRSYISTTRAPLVVVPGPDFPRYPPQT